MNVWQNLRELLSWYIIRLFLAVLLFAVLMTAISVWLWPAPEGAPAASPYDQHLLEVDKEALELAYRSQVAHVYEIWMRDYHTGVTTRAATGFANARAAYIEAQARLVERERELRR